MDHTVEACTRALLEAIRNSQEYKNFEKIKEDMEGKPEERKKVDDFRRKAYLLQNSNSSIDLLDEMNRLAFERQEMRKDRLAAEYLSCELSLCRMLQKISMEVMNVTDIQLDALKDAIIV
ncbi:MAG: YlbF family regulator [Lachnospiraceae bacterium]|nr:YlbF family regulator [Lachnospiraceae bacterium]